MAKKRNTPEPAARQEILLEPTEVAKKLGELIVQAKVWIDRSPVDESSLRAAKTAHEKWSDYAREYLLAAFSAPVIADEVMPESSGGAIFVGGADEIEFETRLGWFEDDVDRDIQRIESLLGKLELFRRRGGSPPAAPIGSELSRSSRRVFVVHGHDDAAKHAVARFLQKLSLEPVVLAEQASQGRTIIEKFEAHASEAAFAIVLLTPDDVGAPAATPTSLHPRARQNVVFELGYFASALGRSRVCALRKGSVELPSDYSGVVWVEMDEHSGWELRVAKEMKGAGLSVDLNSL
jgi:hypothetical protein